VSVGAPFAAGLSPSPSSICPRRPSRGCCCSSVPSFLGVVVMSTDRLLWRAPIVLTHWNKWRHYRHHRQHYLRHTHSSLRHPDVTNRTGDSVELRYKIYILLWCKPHGKIVEAYKECSVRFGRNKASRITVLTKSASWFNLTKLYRLDMIHVWLWMEKDEEGRGRLHIFVYSMHGRTENKHGTHQPYHSAAARIETGLPNRKSKWSVKWKSLLWTTDFKY
jgi:hypothetical protein